MNDHAGLDCCSQQVFAAYKVSTSDPRVRFLGVSTLLFERGETAIPTDSDDFWLPLNQLLVPFQRLADNFEKSMDPKSARTAG